MAPRWPQDGFRITQDGPVVKPRELDVLSVMARSSTKIHTITCNAAVSAWEKGGERARALDILGNMVAIHFRLCKPIKTRISTKFSFLLVCTT